MQSKILALALFALLAATVVDAGCCNDYCDGLFSTASNCDATEPKKDVAGCGSDNQEGNCDCTWRYDGDKSESNGCTSITATGGSSESKTWACTSALDYGSNGKCVDQWESFGEALTAGFALAGGLLVATPPPPSTSSEPKRAISKVDFPWVVNPQGLPLWAIAHRSSNRDLVLF
ncbi:hypothetical protein T484DRAFT_1741263 [Baffinella frigidus]|nr:hypothetical protein T484DRAFT_1741263 [Cryptophyta sp. CCMP2293]